MDERPKATQPFGTDRPTDSSAGERVQEDVARLDDEGTLGSRARSETITSGIMTQSSEEQDFVDAKEDSFKLPSQPSSRGETLTDKKSTPLNGTRNDGLYPQSRGTMKLDGFNSENAAGTGSEKKFFETEETSSISSADSGKDLDEKTRNRIISRSVFAHARRLKRQNDLSRKKSTGSFCSSSSSASSDTGDNDEHLKRQASNHDVSATTRRRSRPSEEKKGILSSSVIPVHSSGAVPLVQHQGDFESEDFASPMQETAATLDEPSHDAEAQTGIEDALPGAFAVSGREIRISLASGYDSGFDNETVDNEDSSSEPESVVESVGPTASETPVQAELYEEEQVAHVRVLGEHADQIDSEDEKQNFTFSQKFLILATIVIVTTVLVSALTTNKRQTIDEEEMNSLPKIWGWELQGLLTGPTNQDNAQFGYSIDMSEDGQRIAIGVPGMEGGADSTFTVGSVYIMDLNNETEWTTVEQINGVNSDSLAGKAVQLSANGNRVAIGCPGKPGKTDGYVVVYEQQENTTWVRMGHPIMGEENGFGGSLAMSADGSILAIGTVASMSDADERSVRVYNYTENSWILGATLGGESKGYFGWSLDISGDGERLAVATLGLGGQSPGKLQIFDFNGTKWETTSGSDLEGEYEGFGDAVSLSRNGQVLAVGSSSCSVGGKVRNGCVETFEVGKDEEEIWELLGSQPLIGVESFDGFGSAVALSADGKILAIGGPGDISSSGYVQVLKFENNKWGNVGSRLFAEKVALTGYGASLALSVTNNSFRVAGGAPMSDFDGLKSKVGRVLIFNSEDDEI